MIAHDGGSIVSEKTGVFLRTEDILCIKGGFELEGLKRIKPFELYFKKAKAPVNFSYNSAIKNDLYTAFSLFELTYPNLYPFIIFRNGYVINQKAISNLTSRGGKDNSKYFIMFNTGLEVEVSLGIYASLLNVFVDAMKLDNEKYVKKTIPGFMQTKR